MFDFDESLEQDAKVCVIGAGTFGLRVVGNMVGNIRNVACYGVVQEGSTSSDALPSVSLSRCSQQEPHDIAPLLEKLNSPDLVFIVANPAEETTLLMDICNVLHFGNIPTFLVIPESALTTKTSANGTDEEIRANAMLDGVLVLSEASFTQPYPPAWNRQDAASLQDHMFQLAISQITDLITSPGIMGMDYHDVMVTICGGLMQFGAGISSGKEGAQKAAEKASACLLKQGVELQMLSGCLSCVCGSSKIMTMDDYNAVNEFIYHQITEECVIRLGVINDDSLGVNRLVSFVTARRPSEEEVFPPWVKLYDRYDRMRHSEQTIPDSGKSDDNDEYEVPLWLRKTL